MNKIHRCDGVCEKINKMDQLSVKVIMGFFYIDKSKFYIGIRHEQMQTIK